MFKKSFVLFGVMTFVVSNGFANTIELDTVRVIGISPEAELSKPNSAHVVPVQQIEQQQQTDATRILKQVPGVYVQEEDAYGLRPNIGLRGTHPHRSRKVVILEDGILIGPAPYSAPAAYYTPFMSRIESLEVFKGVASVPYGPNSIGGAVNYITRSLLTENTRVLDLGGGEFGYQKYRTLLSQKWGDNNILAELAHVKTEGFKKIDGGGDSGFSKNDVLLKGSHVVNSHLNQEVLWKLGYADEDSDETYLGLSLDDFYDNPYRRYAASQKDEMVWDQKQLQITYKLTPTDSWGTWLTAYRHEFHRNWSRLDRFSGAGAPSISAVLKDPTTPANQVYYGVLTGTQQSSSGAGSNLVIANNNRYFYSQGLAWNHVFFQQGESFANQIKAQIRYHEDQIKRRHTTTTYEMSATGDMTPVGTPNTIDVNGYNRDTSKATSVSLEDELSWDIYKLTVAARYESVGYSVINDITNVESTRSESAFVPGAGLLVQFNPQWSGLVGINKGVTLVGPKTNESTSPEESINSEMGVRYHNPDQELFAEFIYFQADYSNLKGTCSFSSGCSGSLLDEGFDGGKALVKGLEARIAKMLAYENIYFPVSMNLTVTDAKFNSNTTTSNPEWGVDPATGKGDIKVGDPLPYIPSANVSFNIGTQYKKYSQEFVVSWTGKMYDQALESGREEIPAHGIIDWSGRYNISKQTTAYARIDNLLDKEYLVSLRPYGARPGKDRSWQIGIKHNF
ncbi:MAG: TonB-dependent receptor family protein [Bdellovibrionia bacterium]